TPADDNALIDRLRALDDAVHVIEDGLGATAAADLRRALDLAREQIAPGTGMAGFSARQAGLTRLLDALQSQADPVMRRRIADLRAALDSLAAGDVGEAALAARRADKTRLLDRLSLELELVADPAAGPTASLARGQAAAATRHLVALR